MHSAKEGHMRCVRILLKHGARVFAHVKGSTSKELALNNGNGRIAELLAGSEESEIRNGAVPAYSRVYDPRSGSYYYYHNFTGITVRKNAGEYYGTNWYIKKPSTLRINLLTRVLFLLLTGEEETGELRRGPDAEGGGDEEACGADQWCLRGRKQPPRTDAPPQGQ